MTNETHEQGVLRSISWRDLCPWTILFRLYRLSVSVQLLGLALLGVGLSSLGWTVSRTVILTDASLQQPSVRQFLEAIDKAPAEPSAFAATELISDATEEESEVAEDSAAFPSSVAETVDPSVSTAPLESTSARSHATLLSEWWHGPLSNTPVYGLVEPFRRFVLPTTTWNASFFYFAGAIWSLLVWGIIGGAITRTAVVRLGRDERVGLRDSLKFSLSKLLSFLGAPLLPLSAVFVLGIPLVLLGLFMRTNVGVAMAGVIWPLVGLLGLVMALFAIGVLFGWPLMWSAISAEGSDAFDAISRSYAYTYQRPLQYLAYGSGAAVLGFFGWIIVGLFCQAIVQFPLAAIEVGAGESRMAVIEGAVAATETPSRMTWLGAFLIEQVNQGFLSIQTAYGFSFLWSAAAAIYLLLRRDADHTELDDVFVEDEQGLTFGLPKLQIDEAGVPGVVGEESDGQASNQPAGNSNAAEATSQDAPSGPDDAK